MNEEEAKKLDQLQQEIENAYQDYVEMIDSMIEIFSLTTGTNPRGEDKPDLKFFGDTLICTFTADNEVSFSLNYLLANKVARVSIRYGLQHGFLWRGVISKGEYFQLQNNPHTILGEAISDAASWYEEANWMGVHYTPKAEFSLRKLIQKENLEGPEGNEYTKENFSKEFISYNVPLKNEKREMYTIPWPYELRGNGNYTKEDITSQFLEYIDQISFSKGHEDKYYNSLNYFEDLMGDFDPDPDRPLIQPLFS